MAFSLLGSVSVQSTNSNTVTTATFDSTGADLLVVWMAYYTGGGTPTLSDSKSNTWNLTTARIGNSAGGKFGYIYTGATFGTSHTLTATGTGVYPVICASWFSGSLTSATPFEAESAGGTIPSGVAQTLQPGSLTPSADNFLMVTGIGTNPKPDSAVYTIGDSFTISNQKPAVGGQSIAGALAHQIQTTATARNPTWSWTVAGDANAGGASQLVFKVEAGAASGQPTFRRFGGVPFMGGGTQPGSHKMWGRSREGLSIPRWLAEAA